METCPGLFFGRAVGVEDNISDKKEIGQVAKLWQARNRKYKQER